MKIDSLVVFVLLLPGLVLAPSSVSTAGQAAAKPPLDSVEARWSGVFCDLTELSRPSAPELSLRFQYRNLRKEAFRLPNVELVRDVRVFDPAGRTLYGVLKGADGQPLSSTIRDGASSRPIAVGRTQAHWARLEPPPPGVEAVTVLIDGCLPFENVAIGRPPGGAPLSAPVPAIASQDGDAEGLRVEVTRLARTAGGLLSAVVRYTNTGSAAFRFPNRGSASSSRFASAYVVDSASRRKFEVSRDKAGQPLSSESIELGASSLGETLAPGAALNLWAMLAAPADSTRSVSLYVALAPPFDEVPISGTGSGTGEAGSAVAGAVVGLDAALKTLGAKVTDTEIRIDLAADVLFDFDKADIRKEAEPSLQNVATVIKANPGATVSIEGHTDGRGADDYNQKLSEARAAGVEQWLVTHAQASPATMTTRGWGESKPVAHNTKPDGSDDPEGRAKNRRVEIVVRKGR